MSRKGVCCVTLNYLLTFLGIEAIRKTIDLIHLALSWGPLDGDVPERVWTGQEVSYTHLRLFGCRAYVHIQIHEISKLDDNCKPFIFLGYDHEDFGYKLYNLANKNVIRSSNVVFLEDLAL